MGTIFHSTSEMLKSLLDSVKDGRTQLPDFQRGWVWDDEPVTTRDSRGKEVKRWYYLDINVATDPDADKDEAIVSVPEDKIIKGKGGVVLADYSTMEKECIIMII